MMQSPNIQQQAVINHLSGPALVIAGPGSGKSFSLVERIANLILNHGVKPEELFVATFTEKAANELISRIGSRMLEVGIALNVGEMYVGTFHSLCLRILEDYRDYTRLKKIFRVMDQFDQTYFIYQNLYRFERMAPIKTITGKDEQSRWYKAKNLCDWMNRLSEEMITVEDLRKKPFPDTDALAKWRELYLALLEEENLLDFSLIQFETYELLKSHQETVQNELKERYRHILVDEYQDTNSVQEKLLFALLNQEQNICVVGDDDQGLYRFRGATIRNILEFPDKFPKGKCAIYPLTVNYRSDPGIIDFYNRWMDDCDWEIDDHAFRYKKEIIAPAGKTGIADPVLKLSGDPHSSDWHEKTLQFLLQMKHVYLTDWNQAAFLFYAVRNGNVKALAAFLEKNGIPVHAPRSDMFFERNEIRLMVGAFLYIFRGFEEVREEWKAKGWAPDSIKELWNYYRGCVNLFDSLFKHSQREYRDLYNWCVQRSREIRRMTRPLDYGWATLFYQLLQFEPFAGMVNISDSGGDERPARNLAIFSGLLVKFEYLHHIQVLNPDYLKKNITDFFQNFLRFLWQGGIDEYEDPRDYAPKGAISFMTIHQAKGLEFPVTFVGSLWRGPRKEADLIGELLNRRKLGRSPYEPQEMIKVYDFKRLFYTAFSRARNLLVLTCQEKLTETGKLSTPTRYFHKFYKPLPDYKSANLNGLEVDKIRDSTAKNTYSYTSHILMYEACPRQYQFFRYLEFTPVRQGSMVFGTLVHETIEDIHKQALANTPENITPSNIKIWFDRNYRNISRRERVYLAPHTLETAYEQVMRYVEHTGKYGDWSDIRGTEVDVSLMRDEYILKGKIDLIKGAGDTVEILDFKAMSRPKLDAGRELTERYKRQLEIYAWLVEQRYNLKVSGMKICYTGEENGSIYKSFSYNPASIDKTIGQAHEVIGKMENREFAVDKRPDKSCKDCDLKAFCDRNL